LAFQIRRVVQALVSTGVVQIASLASGVLIARLIGAEDRGYLAHIIAWYSFIAPLALIGIDDAATFYLSSTPGRRGTLIGSSLLAGTLTSVLAMAGCFGAYLISFSNTDPTVRLAALTFILFAPLFQFNQIAQNMLQTGGAYSTWNALRVAAGPLYILGIVTAALMGRANVFWVVVAQLASVATIGTIGIVTVLRRWPALRPDPALMLSLFRFGRFSMFQRLTIVTRDNLDRILLPLFVSMTDLGHYAVASALGFMVFMVGFTLDLVAFPTIAGAQEGDRRKITGVFIRFGFTATLIAGIAALILIGPVIRILMGAEFIPSIPLARLLVVAGMLQSCKMSLATAFKAFNRPGLLAIVESVSTAIFVVSLLVLVPLLGVVGACYAQIGTTAASALTLVVLAHTRLGIPLRENGLMRLADIREIRLQITGARRAAPGVE
jgi:O-antigen/teichoic acid export membrane protein